MSATGPSGARSVDAIDLLRTDHAEIDTLFRDYHALAEGGADAGDRRSLSTRICGLVAVHSMIEEEIFYPAAQQAGVDAALVQEAAVEHRAAKDLIFRIGESRPSDSDYDAKVKVLREYVALHVAEEEEELFAECRKTDLDLQQIGARLQRRKEQLMRKLTRR